MRSSCILGRLQDHVSPLRASITHLLCGRGIGGTSAHLDGECAGWVFDHMRLPAGVLLYMPTLTPTY